MSDLISRADAIEAVQEAIYNHDSAIMRITALPSADAVQADDRIEPNKIYCSPQIAENVEVVVRCKDCRFSEIFQNDSSGVRAMYCKAFTFDRMVAEDDYCSYGERREE